MVSGVKVGDRIRLLDMAEDPDPIAVGSLGTVTGVVSFGSWSQVIVDWDCGRGLILVVPPDRFEVLAGEQPEGVIGG